MPVRIEELAERNPWWANKEVIIYDRNIKKLNESKIEWVPRLKYRFILNQDAIYTIRGPRQVGKTTLIKMMIQDRLKETSNPKEIFFYPCDLVESPKELAELLKCYIKNVRETSKNRIFIFIDEISSIHKWQNGIKHLVDIGLLENSTVILTGSHSLDIRNASERLPGRRGTVNDVLDKIFLPMKFSEYIETRNQKLGLEIIKEYDLLSKDRRLKVVMELANGHIPLELKFINNWHSKELQQLFSEYLLTGGVALAIDSFLSIGQIAQSVYDTYIAAMLGDVTRWEKKEDRMAQVVQRLIENIASPVSWQSMCKQTDLSAQSIEEYTQVLQASFTISTIYQLDRNKGAPIFEKDKKLYFQDPFIFHALRSWSFSLSPFESAVEFVNRPEACSKLFESVISNHLIRLAFSFFPTSDYNHTNKVYYWRTTLGKEVDFAVKLNGKYLPIEVKYQDDIKRSDLQGLHTFIKGGKSYKGIMITKDKLKVQEDIVLIPYYLFLLLV